MLLKYGVNNMKIETTIYEFDKKPKKIKVFVDLGEIERQVKEYIFQSVQDNLKETLNNIDLRHLITNSIHNTLCQKYKDLEDWDIDVLYDDVANSKSLRPNIDLEVLKKIKA